MTKKFKVGDILVKKLKRLEHKIFIYDCFNLNERVKVVEILKDGNIEAKSIDRGKGRNIYQTITPELYEDDFITKTKLYKALN